MSRLLPVLTWAVVVAAAAPTAAQEGFAWRPEDRTVLTSFHLVSGVTRDERRVYAASEGGLQILDLLSGRPEPPSTAEDGYPVDEGPAAAAFDHGARVVWLGTTAGNLHTFQPDFQRWRLEASPGVGPILAIVPERGGLDDGVLFRTPTGWYRVDRFGSFPQPVPPGRLPTEAALRTLPPEERLARVEPAFAAARGALTTDPAGRTWPLTDFVGGDRPSEYWLGTAGGNLYLYDARFYEARPVPFGLLTPGSGALALDGTTVWIGGDGRGPRRGPVRAGLDLQTWDLFEAGVVAAPPDFVQDILVGDDAVWFAARSGIYRLDRAGPAWAPPSGAVARTPARRLSPARGGGAWVSTDRGLVRLDALGGEGPVFFQGRAVRAAVEDGTGVWVGGDQGLVQMSPDGRVLGVPPGGPPPPPGPIVDLVRDGGVLWAATPDALWRHEGRGWEGPLREVPGAIGRLTRLRSTGGALWVAGEGGAARWTLDGSGWTYLLVGRDLPEGPVWDVQVSDRHILASTPQGVVRLRRRRGY